MDSVKKTIVDKEFDDASYLTLCNYVLDEFSLAYHGIRYDKTYFGLFFYPRTDAVAELIEGVKKGISFPELSKKLDDQIVEVVFLR